MEIDDLTFEKNRRAPKPAPIAEKKRFLESFYLSYPFFYFLFCGSLSTFLLFVLGVIKLIELLKM